MKIDHKTMLEAFEETDGRGDVLSIPREDLVRLKAVPFERFAPIFYQLFKWFVDGDETPLEDPIANAMLEGYKEHQRQNALRREAFLVAQANRSAKGVAARKAKMGLSVGNPRNTNGQPVGNPRITQAKAKAEAKAKAKAKAFGLASGGGRLPRAKAAPPTTISEKEAKKFLAMNAPQISTLPNMKTAKGNPTMLCSKLLTADVADAIEIVGNEILGDDRDEETCTTFDEPIAEMAERMAGIGKEAVFRKVLVKAMVDSDDDEVDNPAAFVMARCKKGEAAIMATSKR